MDKIYKFIFFVFSEKSFFEKKHRHTIMLNILLSIIYGFLELVGIGLLIVFFINFFNDRFLVQAYNFFSEKNIPIDTKTELIGLLLFFIGIKYLIQFLIVFKSFRNLGDIKSTITSNMLRQYLNTRSDFLLNENISGLIRGITSDTQIIFLNFIRPCMEVIKEFSVLIFLVTFIVYFNGINILLLAVALLLIFFVISRLIAKFARSNSEMSYKYHKKFFKNLSEYFLVLKEIRMRNYEKYFINKRSEEFSYISKAFSNENIIQNSLRFIFEIILVCSVIFITFYFVNIEKNEIELYKKLLLIFIPFMRLMPAFVRMNGSINKINFQFSIVNGIEKKINLLNENQIIDNENNTFHRLNEKLELKNISFSYKEKEIIKNSNLEIRKNHSYVLVGPSGQGKTTLIEILLGLKEMKKGDIFLDNKKIDFVDNYFWRKMFGYVPQDTYLIDSTIKENITFAEENNLDKEFMNEIIRMSKLDEFINNLPNGIESTTGSLGKFISGGQKQRIGLARALYSKPDILVMDEPTSSLNFELAVSIIQELKKIDKTLLVITHDQKLINYFDFIIKIDDKKISTKRNDNIIS